jgi:hypothetical protein
MDDVVVETQELVFFETRMYSKVNEDIASKAEPNQSLGLRHSTPK